MNQPLLVSLTLAVLLTPLHAATVYDSGLVGRWQFNSSSGNTTPDSSASAHTGYAQANAAFLPNGGIQGGAVVLDGADDRVQVTDQGNLLPTSNQITVSTWINMTGANSDSFQHPLAKWNNYHLRVWNNRSIIRFTVFSGSSERWVSYEPASAIFNLNSWHHVLGTYDGSVARLYFDGQLVASNPLNITMNASASHQLMFGAVSWSGSVEEWKGKLDEIAIWNRALAPSEVLEVYQSVPEPNAIVFLLPLATFALRRARKS